MLKLSRFVAMALAFAFSQLPLGGASAHCALHDGEAMATSMDHMAMPMDTQPQQLADESPCDHCGTPEGNAPPCDHTAALGGCASMGSCGAAPAVIASAAVNISDTPTRVITTHVQSPPSPSLSQDTPPPRA